jgi:hypothetical protein
VQCRSQGGMSHVVRGAAATPMRSKSICPLPRGTLRRALCEAMTLSSTFRDVRGAAYPTVSDREVLTHRSPLDRDADHCHRYLLVDLVALAVEPGGRREAIPTRSAR